MSDLSDFLEGDGAGRAAQLRTVRIGDEPAMVLAFTSETEDASLHFEPDPAVNRYVICRGLDCPHCFLGAAPMKVKLLPVYNVESGSVEVLQVPSRLGPNELGPTLARAFAAGDVDTKLFVLSRSKNRQIIANIRPLPETADHGERAIQEFVKSTAAGLRLSSAYWCPTAAELAAVDRVKRKLDATGGYEVPEA